MKKLLSIIGTIGLGASAPASLLANAPLERAKRDVGISTNSNNYKYLNFSKLSFINEKAQLVSIGKNAITYQSELTKKIYIVSKDNIKKEINIPTNDLVFITTLANDSVYFNANNGVYVLKQGESTAIKISGLSNSVKDITSYNNDVYFNANNGVYVLKQGESTAIKINGINDTNSIAIDNNGNLYYGTDIGAFVLKQGSTTPTPINGISGKIKDIYVDNLNSIYFINQNDYEAPKNIYRLNENNKIDLINGIVNYKNVLNSMSFNKNNDAYIATNNGIFLIINNSDTATQIDNIDKKIIIDLLITDNNDLFYSNENGVFVLKQGSETPTKIDGISNFSRLIYLNKLIYAWDTDKKLVFSTETNLNWIKKYSNFNLVDKSKNIAWLRDDQLVANGQVKVKIANTDIDTVKVNGAIMPSPDKNWDFNLPVDSTTVENKDYQIEIAFKVDGKSYTGQIIVSSLLAQPSIMVQKNTSPFGNVASYVYQVPTNDKVGEFTLTSDLYYSDTEVKVSLNKPTGSTVQSGVVYGLNNKWEKNGQQLDITGDVSLNATMLNSYQGRFLVETKDNVGNKSNYYIDIWKDNLTPNFWDIDKGQYFYSWANLNGYNESIKKLNATELNKIVNKSKNWQQIANDSQFASAVSDWFKTNGKLSSKEPLTKEQVVEQLKTQIPSSITIDGVNTSNYDVNKVSFELNQSEFNPNDKVNITVKYNTATAEQFTLQIKDSNIPNKLSNIAIAGIAIGSVAGVAFVVLGSCYLYQYLNKKKKAKQ